MSTIEKALAKQKARLQQSQEKSDDTPEQSPSFDALPASSEIKSNITSKDLKLELDLISLEERGYLIDSGERKSIKDEFRQIKRKLLNNAFGSGAKTLNNSNLKHY